MALLPALSTAFGQGLPSPITATNWQAEITVPVQATATESPPSITLRVHKNDRPYEIHRKGPHDISWSGPVGSIALGWSTWTDTNVVAGQEYEYRLYGGTRQGGSYPDTHLYGYIRAGIAVDMTGSRGRVIVLVDSNVVQRLPEAFARYKQDLAGDGWTVHTIETPKGQGWGGYAGTGNLHIPIRDQVITLYNAHPGEVKHVVLLGNVPGVRTGLNYAGPDGHGNKAAFGADCYYADVDGTWTDTGSNSYTGALANIAGDGRFDQTRVPADDPEFFEMGFGRIDMPFAAESPLLALSNYLDKLHRYKHAVPDFRPGRRAMIRVGGFDNVSETGWNSAPALVGLENTGAVSFGGTLNYSLDFDQMYTEAFGPFLFHFKGNAGPNRGVGGKAVFWTGCQSGWGYWYESDSMAKALAEDSFTLSYTWSVWGLRYFYHRMGLGDVAGDMMKTSINNRGWHHNDGLYRIDSGYWPNGEDTGVFFMNHLGDPMLRLFMFPPPSGLAAEDLGPAGVRLAWTASEDPDVIGYHVYRAANADGPFTKLTPAPSAATTYTDAATTSGTHVYMVRAVKLEATGSGTFYNASQGVFRAINLDAAPPAPSVATAALPAAFFDSDYRAELAASGGAGPYAWSLAAGSSPLPEGVTLSGDGVLSGVPLQAGAFPVTVQVTDSAGATATRALPLAVGANRQVAFVPVADAHVVLNSSTENYGGMRSIDAHDYNADDGYLSFGYLRFQTALPAGATSVARAVLRIWPNENTTTTTNNTVWATLVDDDTWTEGTATGQTAAGITWSNRPPDSALAPAVSRSAPGAPLQPFEIDATSLVNADLAADTSGVVTLRVEMDRKTLIFPSRESIMAAYLPKLLFEYPAGPALRIITPAADVLHLAPGQQARLEGVVRHPSLDPSALSLAWSATNQAAGGSAAFSDPAAAATWVSFDTAGVYTLTLAASDGTTGRTAQRTVVVSPSLATAVPPPDILHLPFDEAAGTTTADLAGGAARALTDFNASAAWIRDGKFGGALDFSADASGKRAHVVGLTDAQFNFALDRPWTVSLWVRLTNSGGVNIAGKALNSGNVRHFRFYPEGSLNRTTMSVGGADVTLSGVHAPIHNNRWRMLTIRHEPGGQGTLAFVDGGADSAGAVLNITGQTTDVDFLIGAIRNTSNLDIDADFDGQIDDVRVYGRALSLGEIRSLYLAEPANRAPVITLSPPAGVVTTGQAVALAAQVADDGLPDASAPELLWEQISGPGSATFSNPASPSTSATFPAAGTYLLRLSANDGGAVASATVAVAVFGPGDPLANAAPALAPSQTPLDSHRFRLQANATDDSGAPAVAWRQIAGPGAVTLTSPGTDQTEAILSGYGEYVVEASASDGTLTTRATVTLASPERINSPPSVNAGASINAIVNVPFNLAPEAGDDGLPNPPGALTYEWTKVSGPGSVTFGNASARETTAACSAVGTHILRLRVSDGEFTTAGEFQAVAAHNPAGNQPPTVALGEDQESFFGDTVFLTRMVSDDGLPDPPAALSQTWEKLSGPGNFATAATSSPSTVALAFDQPGTYELRLTANDALETASDQVAVNVREARHRVFYAWGQNNSGQAGLFESGGSMTAPRPAGRGWVKVLPDSSASLALTPDGRVLASGSQSSFLLGEPGVPARSYFAPIPGLTGILDIACATESAAALHGDGTVSTWGTSANGSLGNGVAISTREAPAPVSGLSGVAALFGYYRSYFAVKGDGAAWAWGYNSYGKLGLGHATNALSPAPVPGLAGADHIALGAIHSVVVKTNGAVFAAGYNYFGSVGDGTAGNGSDRSNFVAVVTSTAPVAPLAGIVKAAAGFYHTIALGADGRVWAWGYNSYGQLGVGDKTHRSVATPVLDPDDPTGYLTGVADIAAGYYASYALKADGSVLAWGRGGNNVFGAGQGTADRTVPGPVGGLPAIAAIHAGHYTAFAATPWATYDAFAADAFTPEQIAQGQAAPGANPEGDGGGNLFEYLFQTDPWLPDQPRVYEGRIENGQFVFTVEHLAFAGDIAMAYETSSNLTQWSAAAPDVMETANLGDTSRATLRFNTAGRTRLFLRVKAALQTP